MQLPLMNSYKYGQQHRSLGSGGAERAGGARTVVLAAGTARSSVRAVEDHFLSASHDVSQRRPFGITVANDPDETVLDSAQNMLLKLPLQDFQKFFAVVATISALRERRPSPLLDTAVEPPLQPYFCTFPECKKTFEESAAWIQHERFQNAQAAVWRCSIEQKCGTICGKVCHRPSTLEQHLENDHGVPIEEDMDKIIEARLIGGTSGSSFWCGFCELKIEAQHQSHRFDHIKAHLLGGASPERCPPQWKHLDSAPFG